MKLQRIDIFGFKSFRERTALDIADGVTAVVGPNGCGKSNIVDAIRWALGSQSPKDLRGRAMDDVIFGGSERHRPAGFAEVNLVFSNRDRSATGPWRELPEIRITRRLFRTGESEYEINSNRVRLRDVQELFLGTGVSVQDGYSIIEQGRVGFIVSARPEERRAIIEEAAGVTRYKFQRRTAERRLEQTRANLTRVDDVLAEIERTARSLERQARKAARWKELDAQRLQLALALALRRFDAAVEGLRDAERALEAARTADAAATAAVASQLAAGESLQVNVFAEEKRTADASEAAWRARSALDLLENTDGHQRRERASLEERVTRGEAERDTLRRRAEEVAREDTANTASLGEIQNDLVRLRTQRADEEQRLVALRDAARGLAEKTHAAAERLRRLRLEHAGRQARLEALDAEGVRLRDRARSAHEEVEPLRNRVLQLEQELGSAREAEAVAGQALNEAEKELVQRRDAERARHGQRAETQRALREAQREADTTRARADALAATLARGELYGEATRALLRAERSGAVPPLGRPVAERLRCADEDARRRLRILGPLLEAPVVAPADATAVLQWARTGDVPCALVVLVEPVDGELAPGIVAVEPVPRLIAERIAAVSAVEDATALDPGFAFPVIDPGGVLLRSAVEAEVLRGKAAADEAMALASACDDAARRAAEAETLRRQAEAGLAEAERGLEAALEQRRACEEGIVALRDSAAECRSRVRSLEADLRATSLQAERAGRDAEATETRLAVIDEERRGLDEQMERLQAEGAEAEANLEGLQRQHDEEAQVLARAEQALATVRVEAGRAEERANSLASTGERLRREHGLLRGRLEELEGELRTAADNIARLDRELGQRSGEREAAVTRLREAESARAEAELRHAAALTALREHEAGTAAGRRQLEAARRALSDAERLRERAVVERDFAVQVFADHFRTTVGEARQHAAEIGDVGEAEAALQGLERQIQTLGPVNPAAIEEYEEVSGRLTFLNEQKADLEAAIDDLEAAIRRMDRTSRELFARTFEEVNSRFQDLFPRLFRGGRARLELTSPDNMLETGVDVVAQPPGKKLQSLTLLSGGEKALTAVALIFAIFELKPAPFSVLDEVDAPLDEGNVGRFADLVVEMSAHSQFIMITHNKRTMEAAGTLYGVTMEEPGVSKVVGVRFGEESDLQKDPEPARSGNPDSPADGTLNLMNALSERGT